jgi:hypothetical protein
MQEAKLGSIDAKVDAEADDILVLQGLRVESGVGKYEAT